MLGCLVTAGCMVVIMIISNKPEPSNAETMRQQAIYQGMLRTQPITESHSQTTQQNGSEVVRLVAEKQIRSIVLVTSVYCMQRSRLEFVAKLPWMAIRLRPVAMDKNWSRFWWLTPWGRRLALGELMNLGLVAAGGLR